MTKGKTITSNTPITYSIIRIRVVNSEILENYTGTLAASKLEFGIEITFNEDDDEQIVGLELKYSFYSGNNKLHHIETYCEYQILEKDYLRLQNENIKTVFFMNLAEISAIQTRGLQSNIINDTFLDGYYIPVLSKSQLRKLVTPAQEQ